MKTPSKSKFKQFVKNSLKLQNNQYVKQGYVFIGKGNYSAPHSGFFSKDSVYVDQGWGLKNGSSGAHSTYNYFVLKRTWDNFVKKNDPRGLVLAEVIAENKARLDAQAAAILAAKAAEPKVNAQNLGTFKEQVDYAESFKGKIITNGKHTGKYEDVEVYRSVSSASLSKPEEAVAKQLIEHQGFFATISFGDVESGYSYDVLAHKEYAPIKIGKLPVKVRGYTAVKKAKVVNFGCADIDTEYLKAAGKFLTEIQKLKNHGNRELKVYVGDGNFTLDIINRLELG